MKCTCRTFVSCSLNVVNIATQGTIQRSSEGSLRCRCSSKFPISVIVVPAKIVNWQMLSFLSPSKSRPARLFVEQKVEVPYATGANSSGRVTTMLPACLYSARKQQAHEVTRERELQLGRQRPLTHRDCHIQRHVHTFEYNVIR